MQVSNKSKLTPQVNELMEDFEKLQMKAISGFLKIKENQKINCQINKNMKIRSQMR